MVGVGRGALTGRARAGLRRHRGFGTLLALAAGLRAVVSAAYQPALIFPDSVRYLQYAQHFADGRWTVDGLRQSGYSVLLIPVMMAISPLTFATRMSIKGFGLTFAACKGLASRLRRSVIFMKSAISKDASGVQYCVDEPNPQFSRVGNPVVDGFGRLDPNHRR